MQTFILAGIALPIMFVLDLIWIGGIAQGFYKQQLGSMLASNVVWPAALVFYVIFTLALAYFAIGPAVAEHSFWKAVLLGGFLGLAAYATYDLTNWAVITNWPPLVSIVDLAWGTFISAVAAGGAYLVATKVLGM